MSTLKLLREIVKVEEAIRIDDPVEMGVKRVEMTTHSHAVAVDTVASYFENRIASDNAPRLGDTREDDLTVRVMFTCYDARYDTACEMAVAFYDATKDAFDKQRIADQSFNQTAHLLNIRTEQEVPTEFEGMPGRPGFELLLDFVLFKDVS